MPDPIRFRAGQKQSFIAARSFALGNTGSTVPKGAEVLFDGSKAEVDGSEYSLPQLRGAIKAGWLVLADDYDENDMTAEIPVRANVQVRHAAQGGNPMQPNRAPAHAMQTTENDEREVGTGSISQRAAMVRQQNEGYRRGQQVNVARAGETVRSQRGFETVEPQDGVEVEGRTLKTVSGEKAKQTRTVMTSDTAGRALQEASNVKIEPKPGVTEEEYLERLDPEAQELYLAEKAALRAQYVDDPEPPRVVRKVKTARTETREGITAAVTTGGGIETADPSYGGKAKESVIVQDGITFRTTNGPERDLQPPPNRREPVNIEGSLDVRRQIASAMCPDFPGNYDFNQTDRKKLARLAADYDDRPDVIRAVFAAEGDGFKEKLIEEFPQAFGR
jgi:hypothetical protein